MAQVYPPSSIDLWKTITPHTFHIEKNACIPRADFQMKCMAQVYPPPPINHTSMEHHYTKSLGHDDIKYYLYSIIYSRMQTFNCQ